MATADSYYIGDKALTAGGKVHNVHKPVTAEIMGLSEEDFNGLVKNGKVKKGKPPKKGAARRAASSKPPADNKGGDKEKTREERIEAAITSLYNEKGERLSDDDFTQDGRPTCDALNATALKPDEEFITSEERDAAWEKYQAKKAAE